MVKVVQFHSVIKKYLRVGEMKDDAAFQLDVSVSLKDRSKFDLLGFVVCIDLNGDTMLGDSLEYSTESFFVLETIGAPEVDDLYYLVKRNIDACVQYILTRGGEEFRKSMKLDFCIDSKWHLLADD